MRKSLAGFLLAAALAGCGPKHASFVKVDEVALGRVVIYRNGVAYYERRATVMGGTLTVSVPRDRVDDFLKSLTVVDAISQKPLPVSIPRQQTDEGNGNTLVMKLQLPTTEKADVVLTYVTESPAWKPSYRVVVGEKGKVMLEGWAIVDNTSGEDWKGVLVGVGSSSALSFKYDLWSVRQVQRETLASEEKFAVAPPMGVSPYGGATATGNTGEAVIGELGDDEIRRPAGHPEDAKAKRSAMKDDDGDADDAPAPKQLKHMPAPAEPTLDHESAYGGESVSETSGSAGGGGGDVSEQLSKKQRGHAVRKKSPRKTVATATQPPPPAPPTEARVSGGDAKMRSVTQNLMHNNNNIVIEGYADANRADGTRRASDRANIVKNELIDQGIAPGRIKVVTHVEPNQQERVRLVAQAPSPDQAKALHDTKGMDVDAQPVGEAHFANPMPMTVERGSSAMVSMVRQETNGEVVYLYDAESERGNAHFAFRAVRFQNPTDSTLETGPVTVYGATRFIGEGLTEPIASKAQGVVPFALDRQIVVERNDAETDHISRLVTLQRGVLTAEVQHVRREELTITNRLREPAKVFLRHTVTKGWTLLDHPPAFERVGDAHLFEVDLAPNEVKHVAISEATPLQRTLDLNADVTLDMMKIYIEAPEGTPALREQLRKLLGVHKSLVDLREEQVSMRRRLADYKERMDELHMQIMSLQAVKTGNDLMGHLKQKMKEISERVQKTTIAIVDQEEKIMLARVQFQDTLAELTLPDAITTTAKK